VLEYYKATYENAIAIDYLEEVTTVARFYFTIALICLTASAVIFVASFFLK
jgi:hypothetical protein